MKIIGFAILLMGLFFTIYSILYSPEIASPSLSWGPWVGLLVFATGAVAIYKARNEE